MHHILHSLHSGIELPVYMCLALVSDGAAVAELNPANSRIQMVIVADE